MKTAALALLGALLFLGLAISSGRDADGHGVDGIDLSRIPATGGELVEAPAPIAHPAGETSTVGETTTAVRQVSRPVGRRPSSGAKATTTPGTGTTNAGTDDRAGIDDPRRTRHRWDRQHGDSDRRGGRASGRDHGRHGRR